MISINRHNIEDICNTHYLSIKTYIENIRGNKLDRINEWIATSIGADYDFESVVKATPKNLEIIKNLWVAKGKLHNNDFKILKRYYSYLNTLKDENVKYITENGENYTASYLAKQLNTTTCFYCNEHYIYHLNSNGKRIYDFDHFYNKSEYPIFAVSFYNLIPSCKACNSLKKDTNQDFANPYDQRIDFIKELNFELNIKSTNFLYNQDDIDVEIKTQNTKIRNNLTSMQINERYNIHIDKVWDVLKKNHIYNDSYYNELTNNYDIFKADKDKTLELLFGISIINQDFEKRPFSRMISDIISDLDII